MVAVAVPVDAWKEASGTGMAWSRTGFGTRSWNKFIPETIFGLEEGKIALFLRHLWSTDGSITVSRNGRGPTVRTYYSSTSRRLVLDVKRMLLRLGVRSALVRLRRSEGEASARTGRCTTFASMEDQTRPSGQRDATGRGTEDRPGPEEILSSLKANPNVDLVPWEVRRKVVAAMAEKGVNGRELAEALGETYNGGYLLARRRGEAKLSRPRSRKGRAC